MKKINKKKIIYKLEKEIKKLENEINNIKYSNIKISTIKNLKIFNKTIQLITPYVLTASIITGIFTAVGGTPFFKDQRKNDAHITEEFDSYGKIKKEIQYNSSDLSENILYYQSKWTNNIDGTYTRYIEEYNLTEITIEELIELSNKETLELKDIFGEPISSKKIIENNLTEEQINEEAYLRATIYYKDTNDYFFVEETNTENIVLTIFCILLTGAFLLEVRQYRKDYSKFNYKKEIKNIKEEYQPIDIEHKKRILEIKRNNYNRLKR